MRSSVPEVAFDEGMYQTVAWYRENQAWRPLQARLAVAEGEWKLLSRA